MFDAELTEIKNSQQEFESFNKNLLIQYSKIYKYLYPTVLYNNYILTIRPLVIQSAEITQLTKRVTNYVAVIGS